MMSGKILSESVTRQLAHQLGKRNIPITHAQSNFQDILSQKIMSSQNEVRFSAHALQRLSDREIHLDGAQQANLQRAMNLAEEKGARESLILMDNIAFVASVTNRTIITAVDEMSVKENVFTNIDSAVIL